MRLNNIPKLGLPKSLIGNSMWRQLSFCLIGCYAPANQSGWLCLYTVYTSYLCCDIIDLYKEIYNTRWACMILGWSKHRLYTGEMENITTNYESRHIPRIYLVSKASQTCPQISYLKLHKLIHSHKLPNKALYYHRSKMNDFQVLSILFVIKRYGEHLLSLITATITEYNLNTKQNMPAFVLQNLLYCGRDVQVSMPNQGI